MKNEKHVALAKQVYHEWKINNYEVYRLDQRDADRLLEIVAAALSQVETDALASKVVFPDDEKFLNEKFPSKYWDGNERDSIRIALGRYRSQLNLAPNEPEVKAQEWAEKKASDIVDKLLHRPITDTYLCILKDEVIAALLDAADISKKCEKHDQSKTLIEKSDISRSDVKAQGFDEWASANRISMRDVFACEHLETAFLAGQKSKAATLKLPDWLRYHACITGDCGCEIQQDCNQKLFDDIQDAVKSLNEGDGE